MTKDEILDALQDVREQFLDAIDGLGDEALEEPGVVGDWSIKDLMTHISLWEAELVKLLWQAQQGQKPTSVHFQKVNVDEQNSAWFQQFHTRPLERVLADFHAVRKQTAKRVEAFSDRDLNDPQRFSWLGGEPLTIWIENDSFGHEAEHIEAVLAWHKRGGETGGLK